MIKFTLAFSAIIMTSCSTNKSNPIDCVRHNYSDGCTQAAAVWIEHHLTSAHALENFVQRKSIGEVMSDYKIPGISMAFIDRDHIAWERTFGFADLEKSIKVTDKTVFTGASLSKPLTAIATLKLVEKGDLTLDEDVNGWLSGWQIPNNKMTETKQVTLRHLLSHRAGIKNDLWSSYLPAQIIPSVTQQLAGQYPSTDPPSSVISIPGTVEKYSNPGYSIIQKIIEDISAESFEDVMKEILFDPIKMNDSSFQQPIPTNLRKRRAVGYDQNLNVYPYKLFPYKAAGGVWTTPTDLAKFIITLFEDFEGQNNILSPQMMKQVFARSPIRLAFSKIYNDNSQDLIFRHYGSNQGFTCYLVGSLLKRQAMVIMTNSDNGFHLLDYIARAAAEYYQWDYLQPKFHTPYNTPSVDLNSYTGQFMEADEKLIFSLIGNSLAVKEITGDKTQKLTQIGPGEFISPRKSIKYQFLRPRGTNKGPIVWVRVTSHNGSDRYYEKIKQ